MIPASSGVEEMASLTEGQKLHLLNEFDELNRRFDIMLVDTGAGISSNVVYFNLAAQKRIVVVTPEPTSITDAYALLKVMFNQYRTKEFAILMNMVQDEKEGKAVFKKLKPGRRQIPCGDLPGLCRVHSSDDYLKQAVFKRQPIVCAYPRAEASQNMESLADRLLRGAAASNPGDGNIKFFWKRLLEEAV